MVGDEAAVAVGALTFAVSDWFGFASISSSERNDESAKSDRADVRARKASKSAFWSVRRTPFFYTHNPTQGQSPRKKREEKAAITLTLRSRTF
jgi:hypothetical protein